MGRENMDCSILNYQVEKTPAYRCCQALIKVGQNDKVLTFNRKVKLDVSLRPQQPVRKLHCSSLALLASAGTEVALHISTQHRRSMKTVKTDTEYWDPLSERCYFKVNGHEWI
ncbi:hypothetical protein Q5P01_020096 [Channa striata]|uniref:Uncharacterized protein n=1 Tax=Channa striata TaxID=64152 RepID=A0AA88LWU1_CHASR|nr:hypothetical protein Q5P01_020096 [Channa striata]